MTVIFTQAVTYRHSTLHFVIISFLFFCLEEKGLLHIFLITRQKTLDSTGKVNTKVKQKNQFFSVIKELIYFQLAHPPILTFNKMLPPCILLFKGT